MISEILLLLAKYPLALGPAGIQLDLGARNPRLSPITIDAQREACGSQLQLTASQA